MSFLDSRMSFQLAALLVSLAAFAFLAIIAMNLHVRVGRLELRLAESPIGTEPYDRLRGKLVSLDEPLEDARLLLIVSSNCDICSTLLEEINESWRGEPFLVTWNDGLPHALPGLPACARISTSGPGICRELGVSVTPFYLKLNGSARIMQAGPVFSLDSLPVENPAARGLSRVRAAGA